ncbi:ABC transporter ATP-binding protein [Actinomycetospora sp. NBRC 106378]|uniref:ABC transporter transmembrane domain-containing protein n=1 Tax=Actinomycetospora sp. NBRC 106378 TaxID=3032208 RepID=UPI0024A17F6E|nr:ABC transporter ATP-binding protein [Actinomycetospora sp. NBRC 106378]GLZ55906.1 multidrug ABC transporter ATP-binding protein [Actinomycetospora sp. NBRC 106378]
MTSERHSHSIGAPESAVRSVLGGALRERRRPIAAATVLFCGHQAGEALVPVLVGVVIDRAVATGDPGALVLWLTLLGLDFLVLSFCYRWGARRSWYADVTTDQALRLRVADRVLDPRGGAETGRLPGELTSVAVTDAKRVGVVAFALPLGIAALAAMAVAATVLLTSSLVLGVLVLVGTPLLLAAVHYLGRPLERRSGPEQEAAARASGVAADLVEGFRVLGGLRAQPAAVTRYVGASRAALAATLGATRAQALYQGAVLAANGLFLALVALVGGRLAASGVISVGELVAAVGLAQFLVTPLQILGWVNGRLAQGRASARRIGEVLSAPFAVGTSDVNERHSRAPGASESAARSEGQSAERSKGELSVREALDGVDLDLEAGAHVGVVCADPADAAAIVRALARESATPAVVTLDGTDVTTLDPTESRRRVLVAAHDAVLFSGTVAETVGAAAVGDVGPALAAAHADQVAEVLPDGLHSAVSEQGRSLSGGQRQRLALARALAADPPVLVLHDPTTAVDAVTEARIAAGVAALRAGRTTLVVATRPALLAATDRVVHVVGGRVAATGTHAALLDDPSYRGALG